MLSPSLSASSVILTRLSTHFSIAAFFLEFTPSPSYTYNDGAQTERNGTLYRGEH